jgi:hypothetical protein
VLDPGNLYGFPTARGTPQNQSGSNPKRLLPVRSRILRAFPLARATIPGKSDFMLVLNTSVWLEEKFSFCESRFVVKQSMVARWHVQTEHFFGGTVRSIRQDGL